MPKLAVLFLALATLALLPPPALADSPPPSCRGPPEPVYIGFDSTTTGKDLTGDLVFFVSSSPQQDAGLDRPSIERHYGDSTWHTLDDDDSPLLAQGFFEWKSHPGILRFRRAEGAEELRCVHAAVIDDVSSSSSSSPPQQQPQPDVGAGSGHLAAAATLLGHDLDEAGVLALTYRCRGPAASLDDERFHVKESSSAAADYWGATGGRRSVLRRRLHGAQLGGGNAGASATATTSASDSVATKVFLVDPSTGLAITAGSDGDWADGSGMGDARLALHAPCQRSCQFDNDGRPRCRPVF